MFVLFPNIYKFLHFDTLYNSLRTEYSNGGAIGLGEPNDLNGLGSQGRRDGVGKGGGIQICIDVEYKSV